eukprot:TRINITY_DN7793_c0_g1_i1.p1 TRINITY_DN7793_c0_g1~~TRINITY_DN7793_c0_g1_i1.p1  ORF type:complete len:213 (-),score=37.41 TRINITY_DN7793_c0_g1_i1:240-878(-)
MADQSSELYPQLSRDEFFAKYDESKVGEKDLKTPPTCWELINKLFNCSAPLYQSGYYYRYGKMDNCMRYYSDLGKCYYAKMRPRDNAFKREYEVKEVEYEVWDIKSRKEAAEFWERAYPFLFYEQIPQPKLETGWALKGNVENYEQQQPTGKVLKSGERDLILEQQQSNKQVEKFKPEERKDVEKRQEEDFWNEGYWEKVGNSKEKTDKKSK